MGTWWGNFHGHCGVRCSRLCRCLSRNCRTRKNVAASAVCLQLAGLMAAGLLIAQTSPFLRWSRVPLQRLVLQSTALTGLAWMAGAAVTLGLYVFCDYLFFQDWSAREMGRAVMRTGATAVWFVPAIVLAATFHPGALAAAVVLVHNVTRLLYWQWRATPPKDEQPPVEADPLFATSLAGAPPLLRDLASRLLVSTCLQASVVAVCCTITGWRAAYSTPARR